MVSRDIVQFELDGQAYGVPAAEVEEIVAAVPPVRLPGTPAIVEGAVNVRGAVVPVLDLRARFRLAPKPTAPSDHLILARAGGRRIAIRADRVLGLTALASGDIHTAKAIFPTEEHIAGIATVPSGVVLLHELAEFLTRAEREMLDAALETAP
jgi:purine-binding chemotaxis protein CheW